MDLEPGDTTTTTEVPRVVGEPLDSWVVVAVGLGVLVVILVVGALLAARQRRAEAADRERHDPRAEK